MMCSAIIICENEKKRENRKKKRKCECFGMHGSFELPLNNRYCGCFFPLSDRELIRKTKKKRSWERCPIGPSLMAAKRIFLN